MKKLSARTAKDQCNLGQENMEHFGDVKHFLSVRALEILKESLSKIEQRKKERATNKIVQT